ncbi:MAG TPA: MBL fold metallo-hydrolase [Gemmatimonadaceae bacterium]|nr:MBL fold metallo-hydrolase [Gemmatimonadaceae bacterium]
MSDHFDGERFFNSTGARGAPFSKVLRMLREKRTPWPRDLEVRQRRPPARTQDSGTLITFVGHSTFVVQLDGCTVLTDPMYGRRAGPLNLLGPARRREPGVAFGDLPHIDVVLLSHNHYDHCDTVTLRRVQRMHAPLFITPLGNGRLLRRIGATRIEELDWWQTASFGASAFTAVPAQHFSARTPFDRNRALWSGFVIRNGNERVYFAGDTGYMPLFGEIAQRAGPIDVALLPIGAYEPRWFMKDIHMNPAEAVQAHIELGARKSIACHFGTFQLTLEGVDEPATRLREALADRGIGAGRFVVPAEGGTERVRERVNG